jgi:hypothetical protein
LRGDALGFALALGLALRLALRTRRAAAAGSIAEAVVVALWIPFAEASRAPFAAGVSPLPVGTVAKEVALLR